MTADPPTVRVSLFDHVQDVEPKEITLTWEELVAGLSQSEERREKGGRLWSPCTYREKHRKIGNTEAITLVVLDVDDGSDPLRVRDGLASLGLAHVIYSTFNSTAAHPKYRVAVSIAHPIPARDWPLVRHGLYRLIAPTAKVDPATVDATRMFFFPQHPPESAPFLYIGSGAALDPDTVPRDAPAPDTGGSAIPDYAPIDADDPDEATVELARRAVDSGTLTECYGRRLRRPIGFAHTGKDGGRMNVLGRLARELRREGFDAREILAILCAVNDRWNAPPHPDVGHIRRWRDSVMRTIHVADTTPRPPAAGGITISTDWQEGARDVYWSVEPSGFYIPRCPAPTHNGMKCGATVYKNRNDGAGNVVGREKRPLSVPIGDPDRTDAGGERWRLARTICSSAGVFRDPTHVYLLRIPMRLDPRAGGNMAGAVAEAIGAARRRLTGSDGIEAVDGDLAMARANGRGGAYDIMVGDSCLVVAILGTAIPSDLPEYSHVAGLPGEATTRVAMAERLTKILDVVDAHRPQAASWFSDMLSLDAGLRRLHLLAPWGSARKKGSRVDLWEGEKADHREHICWAGELTHADHDPHVLGVAKGGAPLIMVGGPRGLSPLEAVGAANERYIEGLIGLYPHTDIDAFVATAPDLPDGIRDIWDRVRDRPPPSYARRSRGRSYA